MKKIDFQKDMEQIKNSVEIIEFEEGVIDAKGIMWANARKMQYGEFEYKIEEGILTLPGIEDYDYYDKSLEKVVIKEGVTKIGNSSFYGFAQLRSVSFPSTLVELGESCLESTAVSKLQLPDSLISIGAYSFGDCGELIEVTGGKALQIIGEGAFICCESLESVMLPDGLTTILDKAFADCSKVQSVRLPSTIVSIGNKAFSGCSIRSVTIPESLTTIGDEAFNCGELEVATIINPGRIINVGCNVFPPHTKIVRNL